MKATTRKILRNVSLARALSKLGYSSRKEAEALIVKGDVKVNNVVARNPSHRCSLDHDKISVQGRTITKKGFVYIMMNKPVDIVTTRSDEKGRRTVYDILGDVGKWVFPVGRLDKGTSGLLLFTNDNRLGERLTSPKSKIPKTYVVELNRPLTEQHVKVFKNGMMLDGERLMPATVKRREGTMVELTIHEGKNRQVRRMCEALGYEVVSLARIQMGRYRLDNLKAGEWKYLSKEEVLTLTRSEN